ncbi:hypothetical protein O181_031814 [Austropuccinia psidii MF-1]|uniref:Reverse transcriptase Ty1/copia-type domain-containing protein n=1 Tax=Austropuccinia psidii MF-1 TaxID=1389203 RepID=A0A9Q3H6Y8_9BASI|nr:hypothetical protein [Austropuccinia psidii MF-1]
MYLKLNTYAINLVMNNGGLFTSIHSKTFFKTHAIITHYNALYTPQKNPVSERGNCSTSKKVCALLKYTKLPDPLWGEAVVTAVSYENISPLKRDKLRAYTLWHNRSLDYAHLWIPGLEYGDTYAPTGTMATFQLILSLGVTNHWQIHHMNAKTVFLDSILTEDIYLRPPVWNYLHQNDWTFLIQVHVDHMTIVSTDVSRFKKIIGRQYEMENLGVLQHILGIEAMRS